MKNIFKTLILFAGLSLGLIACGDNIPKPTVTLVTLSATSPTTMSDSSQNVIAIITGTGAFDNTIKWTASEGTFVNPTGALNKYIAPVVRVSKTVTITATSQADATKFATSTITVNPAPTITLVTVAATSPTMISGSSQNVTSTIAGTEAFDSTIKWTASEGTFFSPTGALNSYTAPVVTVSRIVTVTATSQADATKFATTNITVNPPTPSSSITVVTVTAASTTLAALEVTTLTSVVTGTGSFSSGVTWRKMSGTGEISNTTGATIDFTADSAATASTTIVRATSIQDVTKFAEVTLNTNAFIPVPIVIISSPSVDIFTKGTVFFQVVIANAPDTVELLRDGTVLVALTEPYQYSWDTTSEPEKTYSITARAKKAGTADVISLVTSVTVDRTAPTVVSRVPANGANNVFLADEISVTFSEPILASSVTTSTAQLQIRSSVVASIPTLNATEDKIVLVPSVLPNLPDTFYMILTGITDKAGNVASISTSNFVAPDWSLSGGNLDFTDRRQTYNAAIAVNSGGNPIVAWLESDGVSSNLHVKKLVGTSWNPLGIPLDVNTNQNADFPAVAIDPSGNPIVTWSESDGTSRNIYAKKLVGNTWIQLGTFLDANTNQDANKPDIAIDSSGNPIVIWSESDGTSRNIYAKKLVGNTWTQLGTAAFLDANTDRNADYPQIAIDPSDNPIVVWEESDGTSTNIYAKKLVDNTWTQLGTAAFLDATANRNAYSPDIALDPSGNPIVTWFEGIAGLESIYVKQLIFDTWTQQGTILNTNANARAVTPTITIGSDGNPIVTWSEFDSSGVIKVYVKKFNNFSFTWSRLGNTPFLNVNANLNAGGPRIASDQNGTPIVVWQESNSGRTETSIYAKRFNRIP